jgi:hypothetical protein
MGSCTPITAALEHLTVFCGFREIKKSVLKAENEKL